MKLYDLLNRTAGWTLCRVSGAMPGAFLNGCAAGGIEPLSVASEGDFSLLVRLRGRDLPRAGQTARQSQCTLTVLAEGGAPRLGRQVLKRLALAAGLAAVLALLVWSRFHIWEIEVRGNENVPTARILDALRECGVSPGYFWPGLTSDNLRSELLIELPELSWATVNIYGSRAEVLVRERVPKPELWDAEAPIDLVAAKAGYIEAVTALNGAPAAAPGKAVLPGEVLISSRVSSAFAGERRVHAAGSVRARTWYELSAAVPLSAGQKLYTGEKRSRWALVIGKNRWNLYKSGGISRGDCERRSERWSLSLGGLFSLPVTLVRETEAGYTLREGQRDLNLARKAMEAGLMDTLRRAVGEGEIGETHFSASEGKRLLTVCLRAGATENIAAEAPAK
ncbi:MAG: sporulation protein YqfD [Oscillospiraceae bacterium]|nr:sporulation protein YqfD [Oscillospiraceae bacterium]